MAGSGALAWSLCGLAEADPAGLSAVSTGLRSHGGAVPAAAKTGACGTVCRFGRSADDAAAGLQAARCAECAEQRSDADSGRIHCPGSLSDGVPRRTHWLAGASGAEREAAAARAA